MIAIIWVMILFSIAETTRAFSLVRPVTTRTPVCLCSSSSSSSDASFDKDAAACLQQRLDKMRLEIAEEELRLPPNAKLSPCNVVAKLMEGLRNCDDPLPDAGYRRLLRSSTRTWRTRCYRAVGAPLSAPMDLVASALGDAMTRPLNHFGILVNDESRDYTMDIVPQNFIVDNSRDKSCWVECQLKRNDELLVTIGVQLSKRNIDGAWLIHNVDWQDFRDGYRPGIGREDWMRDTMKRLGCL